MGSWLLGHQPQKWYPFSLFSSFSLFSTFSLFNSLLYLLRFKKPPKILKGALVSHPLTKIPQIWERKAHSSCSKTPPGTLNHPQRHQLEKILTNHRGCFPSQLHFSCFPCIQEIPQSNQVLINCSELLSAEMCCCCQINATRIKSLLACFIPQNPSR